MANFPLIIANGGSQLSKEYYSDKLSLPQEQIQLFPDYFARSVKGFVINLSLPGSCNKRILRTTLISCLEQKKLNPDQKIIAIIELTFDIRKEIWIEQDSDLSGLEGNFKSVQLARTNSWWENIRIGETISKEDQIEFPDRKLNSAEKKYLNKWQQGEIFFYDAYAETVNLLTEIVMLTSFFRENNIDYMIYRGNPVKHLDNAYLLDTLNSQLQNDAGVIDLFNFSFTGWCMEQNFEPIDIKDRPEFGHPSLEAHQAFGQLLSQKLREVYPTWA